VYLAARLVGSSRIAGTAGFDRLWAEQCRQVLDGYRERVRYRFIGTGPLAETLSAIHKFSPKSIVLYISILRDGRRESFVPMEVVGHVAQESGVAVYGLASNYLEQGIVGGSLFDFGAHGEETGQLCQKLLSGGNLDPGHLQPAKPNALVVNWEHRLPVVLHAHNQPTALWRFVEAAIEPTDG
jgi:hypothetical protein